MVSDDEDAVAVARAEVSAEHTLFNVFLNRPEVHAHKEYFAIMVY